MHPEQAQFIAAIEADWNDDALRLIYSDWLIDHDQPEEAERQRNWPQTREASRRWVENLAASIGGSCDRRGPMTPALLMEAATTYLNTEDGRWGGERMVQRDGESWRNWAWDNEDRVKEFWDHYHVLTGQRPKSPEWFFCCSC